MSVVSSPMPIGVRLRMMLFAVLRTLLRTSLGCLARCGLGSCSLERSSDTDSPLRRWVMQPDVPLSTRLEAVAEAALEALTTTPPSPIRTLSDGDSHPHTE